MPASPKSSRKSDHVDSEDVQLLLINDLEKIENRPGFLAARAPWYSANGVISSCYYHYFYVRGLTADYSCSSFFSAASYSSSSANTIILQPINQSSKQADRFIS